MALISCTLVETPLYCVKAKKKILCLETRNKNHCHSYVPRKHHYNSEIILIRCYLILCILRIGQSTHITNLKIQVSTKMSSLSNHEIWAHDFTVVEDNLYDSAWRQFVRQCSKTICTTVLEDNLYDSARRQFVRQCLKTICKTVLEDNLYDSAWRQNVHLWDRHPNYHAGQDGWKSVCDKHYQPFSPAG